MKKYTALRLPSHLGPAAWRELLVETPQQFPSLEYKTTADITIIGAGFAGLAAARRLLQIDATLNIAVLEAGLIAEGACGRNSGFMIDLPHDLASDNYTGVQLEKDRNLIDLNRRAIRFAKTAVEQYDIDRSFFDEIGKVNAAASKAADFHNTEYCQHLATLNEPCETLDAQAMYEITGSRHYLSGVYTPGTVLLQPAGYNIALATALTPKVALHENSAVTSVTGNGGDWTINTAHGSVTSNKVIMATNGHLESFGFARNRLMHIFLYASMTREFNATEANQIGGQARWGITPSDPMGTTLRRIATANGGCRFITRTCAHYLPEMQSNQPLLDGAANIHQQKFAARFPDLKSTRMEYQWAGHLCMTRNGVSVAQELDQGLFSACAQNGLGATRGMLTGIAAAERALGEKTKIGAFFESEKPPSLLPPPALSKPVANTLLKWKEWRAANE